MSNRTHEFEQAALGHVASLLRVARRLTSHSAAEDLVQDCLLLAWRNFHQFEPGTNARAWLFRILFNTFYGQRRRSQRAPKVIPITAHLRTEAMPVDRALQVSEALDSLPIDHRTVLMLAVVEGFTCAEIAAILSIPIGTVMSRLSRARQAMRSRISTAAVPEGRARKN